jgi:sugar phosphate isomerase/epimerase
MKRRNFLFSAAITSTFAGIAEFRRAQGATLSSLITLDRVGISTWSFHTLFPATRESHEALPPGQTFNLLDYPAMIADRYQVHNLEMVAPHFESTRPSYLQELKQRLTRTHSRLVNMPVDIPELEQGGGLSDTRDSIRNLAVASCKKWIDVAATLGARSVRCDPGKVNRRDLTPTIASYQALASYAGSKGLYVLIENHNGVGSDHPEDLAAIFHQVGPHCGALPDFGNFSNEETRERGLPLLFPYAHSVCHAKGLQIDAQGKETAFDFPKAMKVAAAARFSGIYSIEYEGSKDPYVGVEEVIHELTTPV